MTKSAVIAISLATLALVLMLLMLSKMVRKRILKAKAYRKVFSNHKIMKSRHTRSSKLTQIPILPGFPYKELKLMKEEYIQPLVFDNEIQVVEDDDDFGYHDTCNGHAGNLLFSVKYDLSRSILVVLLSKGNYSPDQERNELNYYITTTLFPQKHKSFQSRVHKTTSPVFNEILEFTVALEYLLLQSLKFSLWSFDRFSHHEIIADSLLHLSRLEKYGLSISREIMVSKKLRLVPKVSGSCGEIFLSLGYLRLAEKLAVIVIEVINIRKIDNKLPNPYVEVTLICADRKLKTKKTSTKLQEQNPIYNETLTFDVPAERFHETSLLFSVVNKDEYSSCTEILGNVYLGPEASGENFDHWDDVRTGSKPTARWHKLYQRDYDFS